MLLFIPIGFIWEKAVRSLTDRPSFFCFCLRLTALLTNNIFVNIYNADEICS